MFILRSFGSLLKHRWKQTAQNGFDQITSEDSWMLWFCQSEISNIQITNTPLWQFCCLYIHSMFTYLGWAKAISYSTYLPSLRQIKMILTLAEEKHVTYLLVGNYSPGRVNSGRCGWNWHWTFRSGDPPEKKEKRLAIWTPIFQL